MLTHFFFITQPSALNTNLKWASFQISYLTYPYHYNKAFAFLNFLYPLTVIYLRRETSNLECISNWLLLGLPSFYYNTLMIPLELHYTFEDI